MAILLSDQDAQVLILAEVNTLGDANIAALMPKWWLLYSPKEATASGLQYWYARRAAIDYLAGKVRAQVTVKTGDDQVNLKEQFANLTQMRADAQREIDWLEKLGRASLSSSAPVSTLPDAYSNALLRPSEL